MPQSPSHRFGQLIGEFFEETVLRHCRSIAEKYDMYLDHKHERPARNKKKEVIWKDINENEHRLDMVFEQGGAETEIGKPRAFIEAAWRRYTKHSKNKVQEISAAIQPLMSKYYEYNPFFGAVLAGSFTENSLKQLKSEGFHLIYFSSDIIEEAFASQGINVHWDDNTPEEEIENRIEQFKALTENQLQLIGDHIIDGNKEEWEDFMGHLRDSLGRKIESISITALYGNSQMFHNIDDACRYIILDVDEVALNKDAFSKYEIVVRYTNGDKIEMQFKEQQTALDSLRRLI